MVVAVRCIDEGGLELACVEVFAGFVGVVGVVEYFEEAVDGFENVVDDFVSAVGDFDVAVDSFADVEAETEDAAVDDDVAVEVVKAMVVVEMAELAKSGAFV